MDTNNKNNPILSVIMPVYEGEEFLEETLNCVLNQSFIDFEFVILDNQSRDNSKKIIKSFQERDKRIKYIYDTKKMLCLYLYILILVKPGYTLHVSKSSHHLTYKSYHNYKKVNKAICFGIKHPKLGEDIGMVVVLKDKAKCKQASFVIYLIDLYILRLYNLLFI